MAPHKKVRLAHCQADQESVSLGVAGGTEETTVTASSTKGHAIRSLPQGLASDVGRRGKTVALTLGEIPLGESPTKVSAPSLSAMDGRHPRVVADSTTSEPSIAGATIMAHVHAEQGNLGASPAEGAAIV